MQHVQIAFTDSVKVELEKIPPLLVSLVNNGAISSAVAERVYNRSNRINAPIEDILLHEYGVSEIEIALAESQSCNVPQVDPIRFSPQTTLLSKATIQDCLRNGFLPWRQINDVTVVLVSSRQQFLKCEPRLKRLFGKTTFAIATPTSIKATLLKFGEEELTFAAETQLPRALSSRNIKYDRLLMRVGFVALFSVFFFPSLTFVGAFFWVVCILSISSALKLMAIFNPVETESAQSTPESLPTISLLIPLMNEKEVVAKLVRQLQKLEYPRAKLEAHLIVEEGDETTIESLGKIPRTSWIKTTRVPIGLVQTKPRALNYSLNLVKGEIVGVYDAEDLPAEDQLLRVASAFEQNPTNTACVQGMLDYYNDRSNWLSRCFTIEYASWFRVVLPGFAKMGLLVPLGGTTLFFKRKILEELGGWDAHNVTEDADLGVRLARHGYRTAFISSVTNEEANARVWPWIKQRSRWLKGYAVTYAVHMKRPAQLLKDLGTWKFLGFQLLFLGTLSQFLLAPLLWSTLLVPFGLPHPILQMSTPMVLIFISAIFLVCTTINLAVVCIGAHRAGKRWLMLWTPTLLLYFPLGTIGAFKGILELIAKPYFWDKTEHGVDI